MSPATFDVDGILFDMDGTLVDSRALVERMWLLWAAQHGLDPKPLLAVAHGRRTYETMKLVAPDIASPEEAMRLDRLESEQEGGETAIPGAAALLASLPADRWAVVTSAAHDLAMKRIALVGLPTPRLLVGAHQVMQGKPHPEGYLKAARELGFAPQRCLVFEDTPPGVQSARASGARVVGMLTTHDHIEGCDAVIKDLTAVHVEMVNDAMRVRLDGETS